MNYITARVANCNRADYGKWKTWIITNKEWIPFITWIKKPAHMKGKRYDTIHNSI